MYQMFGKRGLYRLGAVRFSASIKAQEKKDNGDSAPDAATQEWLKTQQKALAMDRQQAGLPPPPPGLLLSAGPPCLAQR